MANFNMLSASQMAIANIGSQVLPEEIAAIAKRHSVLAAGAGWIPVPGVSIAAEAANVWYMYKSINDALGLKLSSHVLKTVASGVIANLGTGILIEVGALNLLKLIPGIGTAASGIVSMAEYAAITYTSAYIYLKMISAWTAEELQSMDADDLKAKTVACMDENKSEIDSVMKDAKKEFKDVKKEYSKEDAAEFQRIAEAGKESDEPKTRFCSNCGAKLLDGAKFCMECGTKL